MKIFAFADEADNRLDGQIAAMRRNGLDGIEIRRVDGENVSDISTKKAVEIREKLDDAGLTTWSIGSPIGKIDIEQDDFAAHMDKLKHTLEIANILQSQNIRMFSFYIPKGKNPADYRQEVIDRLGVMLDIAKGTGIDLCHENEKGIYGDIASRCLELHRTLPELKGVFDPANFIQCNQDTWEGWQMLHPYIKYMHIKDALADGSVVPAGEGIGNLEKILADFRSRGGNAVSIEPHLKVFEGLTALERAGEVSIVSKFTYPSNDAAFDVACNALRRFV